MDLLRAKQRERRYGLVELDNLFALAGPSVLDPVEKRLQQEAEGERAQQVAIVRAALTDYMSRLTHPLARDSIRALVFGELAPECVMERYGVTRTALNHHVDKLLRHVAIRLGALEAYLAARAERCRRRHK